MGRLDEIVKAVGAAAPKRRLILDNVHKVWIDDMAPLPDLDPQAMYHITTPAAAKRILANEALIPQGGGRQQWGGAPASNSEGKVFFTGEQGVGRWVDFIGQTMPHQYDNPPAKLAVLQFRNPHMDFNEAMARRMYELPSTNVGRQMPTQDWAPQLFQDTIGSRDAGANAFFIPGTVPIHASPRVQRIVSRYGVLAPLLALPEDQE
jgi:hypothetical protein